MVSDRGVAMRAGFFYGFSGDSALGANDPRKFDGTGTPGSVVVPVGTRSIKVQVPVGTSTITITHPDIQPTSHVQVSFEGDTVAVPAATRREHARPGAGIITVGISGGALATDGPLVVTVGAL